MKRTDVRKLIKTFLADTGAKALSSHLADKLAAYLQKHYPDERLGNVYIIKCEYEDFFFSDGSISGKIDRCDSFDCESVIDSVTFTIDKDMRVMVWDKETFALTLDMNNLSEDDLIDIMHIDSLGKIDIHKTFMRIPAEDRGKLAARIPNSMALELFGDEIPPYAFYQYDGQFYHASGKTVGNLGGGVGFGGCVSELGTIAQIGNFVIVIGEHAFDGCRKLTEVHLSGNVHYIGKHAFANIPGLIIRCSAPSKPALWDDQWCDENCTVYFQC